jgi:hypothetical protein
MDSSLNENKMWNLMNKFITPVQNGIANNV